jgi:serine/threonine protein kinase/Tol biopolymer transport system component
MALRPGTKLGAYEVREQIGAGGMGEVYRATDTRLKRDVAIKVLPEEFARDPERLARFRREAQLLASLNHPNIATIHGLEEADGAHFLVMELVSGETLAETIRDSGAGTRDSGANPSRDREGAGQRRNIAAGGPLADARGTVTGAVPIDDALAITTQICEALEHAHEKGVIHRDLKPANVKLTPDGKVKVLDFGLAKAFAGDGTASNSPKPVYDSNSPTVSRVPAQLSPEFSPTIPGTIMGTAAYMSPEQARGKTVDKRTDIWALGCVLYELLTGEGAFYQSPDRKRGANQSRNQSPDREGGVPDRLKRPVAGAPGSEQDDEPDTVQDILARVLHAEPDWSLLPATTPHGVRSLLRRCLEKDARRRLRDAADVRIQIEETQAAPAGTEETGAPAPVQRSKLKMLGRALAGLAACLLAGVAGWELRPAPAPQRVSRTVIPLPPDKQLGGSFAPMVALSPDGAQVAYTAGTVSTGQIYLRAMDSSEARPVAGTEGGGDPFFSPDGQWIGFFAAGKLKKVSVTGGAALTLCVAPNERGATWGVDDNIILAPSNAGGLFKVPAGGGTPQESTKVKPGENSHRWPQLLSDGKALIFTVEMSASTATPDADDIWVRNLNTGEDKLLVHGGTYGRYVPTGHLVFYRAGTIMAVPFDPQRLEVHGTPAPVVENVMATTGLTAGGQFSISNNGSMVYVEGAGQENASLTLTWVDRSGKETPLAAPPKPYLRPRLSPTGRQLAFEITGPKTDIWMFDLARETLTPFTFAGDRVHVGWTPDGKRIVFESQPVSGNFNLFWRLADGSGTEELLASNEYGFSAPAVTPDGKWLAYHQTVPKTQRDIYILPLDGDPRQAGAEGRKPRALLQEPFNEAAPMFSPDGRWLAYVSDESGQYEIYVRPFPSLDGKWRISTDGGEGPLWNPNGRELFYRNGDKMMAVDVTTQPTFSAGRPKMVFEGPYAPDPSGGRPNYDVSRDGQRFLMMKSLELQGVSLTQINVVLNWFEELKAKVPVGKVVSGA